MSQHTTRDRKYIRSRYIKFLLLVILIQDPSWLVCLYVGIGDSDGFDYTMKFLTREPYDDSSSKDCNDRVRQLFCMYAVDHCNLNQATDRPPRVRHRPPKLFFSFKRDKFSCDAIILLLAFNGAIKYCCKSFFLVEKKYR